MARIFAILAGLSTIFLAANLVLGLRTGDMEAATKKVMETADHYYRKQQSQLSTAADKETARKQLEQVKQWYGPQVRRLTSHIWTGIIAALLTLLVNAVAITYSLGTARWCREVVDTYQLDHKMSAMSLQHKRSVFLWAFSSMLVILAIVIFGALADPVRHLTADMSLVQRWRTIHFFVTIIGVGWIVLSYVSQIRHISANSEIIRKIMDQVETANAGQGS